jgi:Lon protease-like protein
VIQEFEQTTEVPLFPLNTVLFPEGVLSLRIFEPRYLSMVSECMKNELPFGVCLIRQGAEVGNAAEPEDIGTLATITDWNRLPEGLLGITATGSSRFRVLEYAATPDQLLRARIGLLPEEPAMPVPAESAMLVELLRRIMEAAQLVADEHRFDQADWVAWRLGELLPLTNEQRQQLLESGSVVERLHRLTVLVEQQSHD